MGLYGNIMFEQKSDFDFSYTIDESKAMSPLDFIEYCEESVLETDLLFESFGILDEGNDIVLSDKIINGEYKEIKDDNKKSSNIASKFVETLKKLWNSFCNMIMKAWHTITDKIKELYQKTNLTDSLISKMGKNVTWENWNKAITNGCPGLSIARPVIGRLIDPKEDTSLSYRNEEIDKLKKLLEDTEKIYDCITPNLVNKDKAKDIYDDISNKLSDVKLKELEGRNVFDAADAAIDKATNHGTSNTANPNELIYYSLTNGKDKKHYFPDQRGFVATKNLAETGQKICKDYKKNANATIANYKNSMVKDNKYLFKAAKKDSKKRDDQTDRDIALVESYYYRAKINCSQKYVSYVAKCFKNSISMMYQQHRVAILTYIDLHNNIKKYAKA